MLGDAINFATQHIIINKKDLTIIHHARKSIPYNHETPWQKKDTIIFDVTMDVYDVAKVCQLVDLFIFKKVIF